MNKKNLLAAAIFFVFVAAFIFLKNYQTLGTTPNPSYSSSTVSQTLVASATEKKISVNFSAGDKKYSLAVSAGSSIYDAMNILASTTDFSFKASFYPGLGYFIDEINGIKNQSGEYWTLYVDGSYSNVGASSYKLKDGDSVEWKYEK